MYKICIINILTKINVNFYKKQVLELLGTNYQLIHCSAVTRLLLMLSKIFIAYRT